MIKLKLDHQNSWKYHRSGWRFVLSILNEFNDNSGILVAGLLDNSFGYSYSDDKRKGIIPFREDWIGFIHSSIKMCPFLKSYPTLESIIYSNDFINSLEKCRGLFTFSDHVSTYIKRKINGLVPINVIKHPTDFSQKKFDFSKFCSHKKVVHVGDWLRKITTYINLNIGEIEKILLLNPTTLSYLETEINYYKRVKLNFKNVEIRQHLSNIKYDELLSESIVFVNLCDSNASNTIIECISRGTPILVNLHESAVEYLGPDYPFYYSSIEEAEVKVRNTENIFEAHSYLKNFEGRNELSREFFLNSFKNSSIIKNINFV